MQNFKSIQDAELEFAPLTVLVGRNSSGKTSLIQSILLVTQAAQGGNQGPGFPLNGPLASVGEFNQARFYRAADPIEFRGRLQLATAAFADALRVGRLRHRLSPSHTSTRLIEWGTALIAPEGKELGWADVASVSLRAQFLGAERDATGLVTFQAARDEMPQTDADIRRRELGALLTASRDEPSLGFSGRLGIELDMAAANVRGVTLRAGVPFAAYVVRTLRDAAASVWVERFLRRSVRQNPAARLSPTSIEDIVNIAAEELREWNVLRRVNPIPLPLFLDQSGRVVNALLRSELTRYDSGLAEDISAALSGDEAFDEEAIVSVDRGSAARLSDAASEVFDFFNEHVVYLGPLRHDPQVVHIAAPSSTSGFIGKRGEYLAAVLRSSRDREVRSFHPDGSPFVTTLARAVDEWAREFEVADVVQAAYRSRFGIEVSLKKRADMPAFDLTSVGVGVSQLLPVIVMCLRTEPGSLILMEQPELHLHPALQQKLGDFILACARTGRQLVVETHSEYLISRLRRRVAEDKTGELATALALYFVEQVDDASVFRRVAVNEFGGIEDWPAGFFDEASAEARQIVQAAFEKRHTASD